MSVRMDDCFFHKLKKKKNKRNYLFVLSNKTTSLVPLFLVLFKAVFGLKYCEWKRRD